MTVIEKLQNAESISDISQLLGYTSSSLAYVLYKIPDTEKYSKFEIPKKGGGKRPICAPIGPLKDLQRRVANILYACREENERLLVQNSLSHGYRKHHSIVTNADRHKRQRYVLNLDLKDFFPAVNFGRVRGYFIKNRQFGLSEKVATLLAQIACFENGLPQGSPCSPVIADLIAHLLDVRLVQLAKMNRVQYSRYADDLTFSTNERHFPAAIAKRSADAIAEWTLSKPLVSRIQDTGFEINPIKTRMQVRRTRQTVTGLTVNAKVNIQATYYRNTRAMCKSLFITGSYYRPTSMAGDAGKGSTPPEPISSLAPLSGMLSHIHYVKNLADNREQLLKKDEPTSARKLYQQFLRFRYFVAHNKPLFICEGKTDNVYLRCAIRALVTNYPNLSKQTENGSTLSISFFNYASQASELMNIKGGTGDLKFLINDYEKILEQYQYKPLVSPVVLLIDNDDGAKPIFSIIKEKFGISATYRSAKPYFHLRDNLYLIKTPSIKGKDKSCIEDLFDKKLLKTK